VQNALVWKVVNLSFQWLMKLIQRAGTVGCKEVVIGMPHRGRLNLLVNIMGKNPADLFGEFEGKELT
jgi:2-oxoglutarate dehydrogenase E1 component